MYIATHFGWVVLSCAVLMFFRKRSTQKTKQKKQSKWNSSISRSARGTEPRRPGPAGDASSMGKGWGRAGGLWSRGSPLLGDHSVASQALLLVYPGIQSRGVFLKPPAAAQPLHMGAGAGQGAGSPCTEPVSTVPLARKRCNKWSLWCLKPISGVGGVCCCCFEIFSFFFPIELGCLFSVLHQEIPPVFVHYAQRCARCRGPGADLCRCPRLPAHRWSGDKQGVLAACPGAHAASPGGFP